MLPDALLAGIGYSDFWKMTFGEIRDAINLYVKYKRLENEQKIKLFELQSKYDTQNAAFAAYWSGAFSRGGKMPRTPAQAFPEIFGRTKDGQIKAENWQESERALMQIAASFKNRQKAVKKWSQTN